jgi:molybdenum cofactor cytidylyltransferase
MGLSLGEALRLFGRTSPQPHELGGRSVAFVGAGGKTTAIFQLARESPSPVWIAASTHLGAWQPGQADTHVVIESDRERVPSDGGKVTILTGPLGADERFVPLSFRMLRTLWEASGASGRLFLIEADGSRQKPLKAPAPHEPPIPDFVDRVVTVAGLSGVGTSLTEASVHRPGQFASVSGLRSGDAITAEALSRVLMDRRGGLKNMPAAALRWLLLNQADTAGLQAAANQVAEAVIDAYDAVVIASLKAKQIIAVRERSAGVVLAAGAAARFGRPKQLLDWRGRPFVRAVAEQALRAGLAPVVVVTGSSAELVEAALGGLPIEIARNPIWREGQASSIRVGLQTLPAGTGAAVFLLADQPQVTTAVIRALTEAHQADLPPIVAPLILDEHRGNPVLFDRVTFSDLAQLRGDVGGRSLFDRHPVRYMPWHDAHLLLDIDTPEQYHRLLDELRS